MANFGGDKKTKKDDGLTLISRLKNQLKLVLHKSMFENSVELKKTR